MVLLMDFVKGLGLRDLCKSYLILNMSGQSINFQLNNHFQLTAHMRTAPFLSHMEIMASHFSVEN